MRIEIANFLRNAEDRVHLLLVAHLGLLDRRTSGSANRNWKFFATRFSNVFRSVLQILICTTKLGRYKFYVD